MIDKILTVRHLEDDNNLSDGLNSDILVNQEDSAEKIGIEIIRVFDRSKKSKIQIITSDQNRTSQSAELIFQSIEKVRPGLTEILIEPKIKGLDQGIPNLPTDYKDGDEFTPLKIAWGPFWEHVRNGDIFYKFGQVNTTNGSWHEELQGTFKELGESYADILMRHLTFLHSLLSNDDNKFIVFIGHSINIRMLKELVEIAKEHSSILDPIKLGEIANLMEEHWDGKRNEFGEIETIDTTSLTNGLFIDELDQEIQILKARIVQNGKYIP